jgi:phosphatidate phosphatase APP1
MSLERRRATRNAFGGVAQLTDSDSGAHLIARTSVLGRFGCFVKTMNAFPAGTTVSIRISHDGQEFSAAATVVHLNRAGMGIALNTTTDIDKAVLEEWLTQDSAEG